MIRSHQTSNRGRRGLAGIRDIPDASSHKDKCQNGVVPTHSGSGLAVITNSVQPTLGRIILNCGFWQLSGIHPVTDKGPLSRLSGHTGSDRRRSARGRLRPITRFSRRAAFRIQQSLGHGQPNDRSWPTADSQAARGTRPASSRYYLTFGPTYPLSEKSPDARFSVRKTGSGNQGSTYLRFDG